MSTLPQKVTALVFFLFKGPHAETLEAARVYTFIFVTMALKKSAVEEAPMNKELLCLNAIVIQNPQGEVKKNESAFIR